MSTLSQTATPAESAASARAFLDMQRAHHELETFVEKYGDSFRHVLEHGRADDVDDAGSTALWRACYEGCSYLVNALLDNGADPTRPSGCISAHHWSARPNISQS